MELTYTRNGDNLFPALYLEEPNLPIGKYGLLRKSYLKEHKRGWYSSLLLTGKLDEHLAEIDHSCNERIDAQGLRSTGVGQTHEQHPGKSGGNRFERIGLLLIEWLEPVTICHGLILACLLFAFKQRFVQTPYTRHFWRLSFLIYSRNRLETKHFKTISACVAPNGVQTRVLLPEGV